MQEKLNRANISRSRKLFDRHISRLGIKVQLVRIQRQRTSIRGDYEDIKVSDDPVTAQLDFPPEMPLLRGRLAQNVFPSDGQNIPLPPPAPTDQAPNTQFSFWDLLPIFMYVKFTDNIVQNDLLLYVWLDENNHKVAIILRVVTEVGSFHSHLAWRKLHVAVENGEIDAGIMTAFQNYLNRDVVP
jgi:hypothetical protein